MNIICALGLLPWMYHFCNIFLNNPTTFHKFIPLFIFANGISYHIFYPNSEIMFLIDTLSNNFFIGYINLTTYNQPETFFCTMISIITYNFNKIFNMDILHIIFIQWLLLFAYIKSYDYEYATNTRYIEWSKKMDLYKGLEFIYDVLDRYAEKVLKIDYDEIDVLLRVEGVRHFNNLADKPRDNEEPNIVQDVTAETDCPSDNLAVGGDDHKLGHD